MAPAFEVYFVGSDGSEKRWSYDSSNAALRSFSDACNFPHSVYVELRDTVGEVVIKRFSRNS